MFTVRNVLFWNHATFTELPDTDRKLASSIWLFLYLKYLLMMPLSEILSLTLTCRKTTLIKIDQKVGVTNSHSIQTRLNFTNFCVKPKFFILSLISGDRPTWSKMAFTQRMVLKSATTMSLHERFSQLRQTVPPPAPAAPTYTPPAARATTAPPSAPPRIYEDDDVGKIYSKCHQLFGLWIMVSFSRKIVSFFRNCGRSWTKLPWNFSAKINQVRVF